MREPFYKRFDRVLQNLDFETVNEIAEASGFGTRQNLNDFLKRRRYKIKHQFVIVPID